VENDNIRIIATSKIKAVSVGGNLDIHESVERGMRQLMENSSETRDQGAVEGEQRNEAVVQVPPQGVVVEAAEESGEVSPQGVIEEELGDFNIRPIPEAEQEEERPGRRRKLRSAADVNREKSTADKEIRRLQDAVTEERATRLLKNLGKDSSKKQKKKAKLKVKRLSEFMDARPYKSGPQDRSRRHKIDTLRAELERLQGVEGDEDTKVPLYANFVSETRGKEYEDGNLAWYDLEESCCYFSLVDGVLFEFKDSNEGVKFAEKLKKDGMSPEDFMAAFAEAGEPVESFRVVTENVPRNFIEALRDKVWGDPARKEMDLLKDKVIVRVSSEEARKIRDAGCE
jgi:hypothetical protein